MNTKTEIDFEKIINFIEPNGELLNTDQAINAMKDAIKAAKPIILAHAAEKAKVKATFQGEGFNKVCDGVSVDPSSITSLNDSQELNKKLGID